MSKDYIILGLTSALIAALVFGSYSYLSQPQKVEPESKIIYMKRPLKVGDLEDRLLAFGVSSAWKDSFGTGITADCFQTELIDGDTIFTMCQTRKKLK